MSIYAISDLHLSFGTEKPMDKFGKVWEDYEERMKYNWNRVVKENDLVLVPGDVSWATYLSEAVEDFKFIDGLNGEKLISKGNHDYWWESLTKLNNFALENEFKTVNFIHNTAFEYEDFVICAAKGYDFNTEKRLCDRENIRVDLSLGQGAKSGKKIILMLHYAPFDKEGKLYPELEELFEKYSVYMCVYGHLHAHAHRFAINEKLKNTEVRLVSCDFLEFCPLKLQ